MNWYSRPVFFLLALSLFAPSAASAAPSVRFSEAHPQYMAALARAFAQEVAADAENNQADLDEDFSPEDFGLTEVGFLPNNPLYIFKAARRGFSDVFTTNPQEKLENSLRFAAEKLLEAKTLSEQGARETAVASALDRFRIEIERARTRAEAASAELGDESEDGAEIARSMMNAVIKYQKLIGKIEKETGGSATAITTEAKTRAGEAFGAAFAFVPPEEAASALSEVLDSQQGSDFRDFKNIEVLKTVEQQVPEAARPVIRAAAEGALAKLEEHLATGESGSRAAFGDFVRNVGGNEARHLAIIQELEVRPLSDEARASLTAAKEEVLSRADVRLVGLSEDEKRAYLSHLNNGNIEDVRVVKELERNVSVEALANVQDIASSAKENFARKVENAATNEGEREKLIESVERFHDATSLSVLDEIAALIPPEQQSVFISLKQKAAAEIQKDISRASGAAQTRAVYQALSGDHPEDFEALRGATGISSAILDEIRSATAELVKARAEVISDVARFRKYEEAFRASDNSGETGVFSDDLSAFFTEQKDVYGSREKAEQKIADVSKLVSELSGLAGSLPLNLGYGEDGFDESIRNAARLLSSAERRLAGARAALARNAFGLAYSEAQEAEFGARDGIAIARNYKSGKRSPEMKPPVLSDGGEWRLNSRYEFQKFCISVGGILADTLSCEYQDGRVFIVAKEGFPVSVPLAFRPTEKRVLPQPEPVVDPQKPLPLQTLDPTKSGRCGGIEKYSCPTGLLCVMPEYTYTSFVETGAIYGSCEKKESVEKRKDISCQAYFEGYVYDSKSSSCVRQSQSGCSNPFIYKTKDACELGIRAEEPPEKEKQSWTEHIWKFADGVETSMILNRTDSEYTNYIKNVAATCRVMPKQQFVWRRGAGNDSADNWKNFGIPDCSGNAFAPANCGNNICEAGETLKNCSRDCSSGTTAGDAYSCPGFAHERIDARGKRYCQLNTKYSCNSTYPQFLYESSYAPSLCPNELIENTGTTATTTGVQFGNCGANVSRYSCETSMECDWYVPPQGSPYCAPAVRGSWVSHTWRFTDGTETSSILSRLDREYSEFIASVDAQCKLIPRTKFAWKSGAGNDAADNWKNFGIPDCSGTASTGNTTGGGTSGTTCDSATTALLGTGCHSMGNAFFNSEMTKYVWPGGSTILECSTGYVSGCSGSGGGTTNSAACSDGRDNDGDGKIDYPSDTGCYNASDNDETIPTTTGGGTTSMQKCFYPNASKNGAPVGYTVWCESDYVNCHEGSPSGASISLTGVSLGAPSQCESGWTGGPSGSCNYNNYCDTWESKATCPVECANGPGTYTTGTCNNNNFCDTWESAASCPSECGSTGGGTTDGVPATPTGVTATAPSSGSSVEIRWTDSSTNETYFKIWRQAGGSWAFLTQVTSSNGPTTNTTTTHTDTNVPSGSVNYQIQACNTSGCSLDSIVATTWVAGGGGTTTTTTTTNTNTTTSSPACSDGRDNDGDGQTDYPSDTGCYSSADTDEAYYPTGSGGASTTCDSALVALLGDGCHQMYTDSSGNSVYCDGPMTKSAKSGDSATTAGCIGSGGGTTSGSSCPSGQYWNGSACVNTSTTDCTSGQYWNGSACVSSSPSSSSSYCGNSICEAGVGETASSCIADCGSTSGGSNNYGSCGSATTQSSCTSQTNCYWNSGSNYCYYSSSGGASIWQSFSSWLKGE